MEKIYIHIVILRKKMFLRLRGRRREERGDSYCVGTGNLDMHVSWMIVKLNHSYLTLYNETHEKSEG